MGGGVVPTDNPADIHPMLDTQENESDQKDAQILALKRQNEKKDAEILALKRQIERLEGMKGRKQEDFLSHPSGYTINRTTSQITTDSNSSDEISSTEDNELLRKRKRSTEETALKLASEGDILPMRVTKTPTATPVPVPQNLIRQATLSPVRPQLPQPALKPQPHLPKTPGPKQTVAAPAAASANTGDRMCQQMNPDTAKIKCQSFLATLLRRASEQSESVARNVRALIQGLIDGQVEPTVFHTNLQKELNSSPQPCLAPFLKKSLPYLQHSLATKELTIEGINPPSIHQIGKLPPAMTVSAPAGQSRPPSSLTPMSAPPHSVMGGQVRTNLQNQPQARIGSLPQARPTFARPGFPSLPTAPLRPGGGGQYSGGLGQGLHNTLLPPPKVHSAMIISPYYSLCFSGPAGCDKRQEIW